MRSQNERGVETLQLYRKPLDKYNVATTEALLLIAERCSGLTTEVCELDAQ